MRHDEPASMMHLIRPILLLVALLLALGFAELASADTARVHDVTGSAGPEITLAQVAELTGEYALSLADVTVGRLEGGETTLDIDTIESALRAQGASMGRLDLVGYGECRVVRIERETQAEPVETHEEPGVAVSPEQKPVTVYTPATVREEIQRQLAEGLALDRSELEFEYRERDEELLSRSVVAGRYRVEPAFHVALGTTTFRIYEYQGTRRTGERSLRVTARQRVLAVVATEAIRKGDLITRQQVRVRETLIDNNTDMVIDDTSLVVGQVAARNIEPGDVVAAGAVQAALAVRRRAVVDVTYLRNGVRISFSGKALEEGSVGQMIEVEHQATREVFLAQVTGTNQVRVGVEREANDSNFGE